MEQSVRCTSIVPSLKQRTDTALKGFRQTCAGQNSRHSSSCTASVPHLASPDACFPRSESLSPPALPPPPEGSQRRLTSHALVGKPPQTLPSRALPFPGQLRASGRYGVTPNKEGTGSGSHRQAPGGQRPGCPPRAREARGCRPAATGSGRLGPTRSRPQCRTSSLPATGAEEPTPRSGSGCRAAAGGSQRGRAAESLTSRPLRRTTRRSPP